ncbi:uncharacterized protein LOC116166261 [Photinus pyralis]|uniref:uncharacterized protein LOC116166261 n=1 Tax=Photinus pyralis TaxID=7054 RepID=UPI001266E970|nr:uncharacterized protein LOC116166261 [Photinus pyralis]
MGSDITDLRAVIVQLKDEVAQLKANFESNKATSKIDSNLFEDILHEIEDRQRRKRNIVVFGADESTLGSTEERESADAGIVKKMLTCLGSTPDELDNVKLFRLGKFDGGRPRPRPIKVIFPNEATAYSILRKSKELKSSQDFGNIYVSSDKTRRQLDHHRSLRKELSERIEKGETNLKIKYVSGCPIILSEN